MYRFTLLLLAICCSLGWCRAESDSLDHILFKSDFEKFAITHADSVEPIDLLLAISDDMTNEKAAKVKGKIAKFIEANYKLKDVKETKQIKKIFSLTHKKFFSKYIEVSNFENIFELKEYNCVSATALYGLVFEAYDIPYQVKQAPSHVYSIAYPGTKDIMVESTAPESGYYYASDNDIHSAIENLINLKFISQEEVDSMGERDIYNEFFYKVEDIGIRELAGLQYYNEALTHAEKEDYEAALNAAIKSRLIYESEKTDYLVLGILNMVMTNRTFDKFSDAKYLMIYAAQPNVEPIAYSEVYNLSIRNTLFVSNKKALVDSIYYYLSAKIQDSAMNEIVQRNYYYAMTEYYYNLKRFSKAFKYADTSYNIDSTNFFIQTVIAETVMRKLSTDYEFTFKYHNLGTLEVMYPFLRENSLFQSMRLSVHASKAYELFSNKELERGLKRLDSMDMIWSKFGEDLILGGEVIVDAYGKGAMLHYKKRNYLAADSIIKRGLLYYPYSVKLYDRLNLINTALNRPKQEIPNKHFMLMQKEKAAYEAFMKARQNQAK